MTATLSQTPIGFSVVGDVTFSNVAALCKNGEGFLNVLRSKTDVCEIDLEKMNEKNAAALALLLAWARAAENNNLKLKFLNTPASLLQMAAAFGLTDFMEQ